MRSASARLRRSRTADAWSDRRCADAPRTRNRRTDLRPRPSRCSNRPRQSRGIALFWPGAASAKLLGRTNRLAEAEPPMRRALELSRQASGRNIPTVKSAQHSRGAGGRSGPCLACMPAKAGIPSLKQVLRGNDKDPHLASSAGHLLPEGEGCAERAPPLRVQTDKTSSRGAKRRGDPESRASPLDRFAYARDDDRGRRACFKSGRR